DVEVRERIVYDESAIDALLGTDPQLKAAAGSLPAARMLAGKVASVRVHARKQS
ncbi:MAG: hypothetical protein HY303_00995, partial [Candidatus Wallbacteria bacterium]|nr:hypothetical protein [Candidatus Wallbacteria bacterium]